MSGFCSRRFVRFLEGFQRPGDRDATRGKDVEVSGWDFAVSRRAIELRGGGGAAGDQRTAFPAASGPLRGGRSGRADRPAPRACFGTAGGSGPDRVRGGAVSHALFRLHGEAFSRSPVRGAPGLQSELHLDEDGASAARRGSGVERTRRTSQEAGAPATAGDDAVSGRLAASLASRRST
jgi:hypothetical protein